MRLSRAINAVAVAIAAITAGAGAQPNRADSTAAVAAVEQFEAALAAVDSARAMSLLADDVMILESGAIQTRSQYLSGHLGADMKASRGSKGVRTVIKATVVGDAAYIVSKTVTPPTGTDAAATGAESAALMVLSRTAGVWKIRAIHWSSRRRRA